MKSYQMWIMFIGFLCVIINTGVISKVIPRPEEVGRKNVEALSEMNDIYHIEAIVMAVGAQGSAKAYILNNLQTREIVTESQIVGGSFGNAQYFRRVIQVGDFRRFEPILEWKE